jgi:hypothetical protein
MKIITYEEWKALPAKNPGEAEVKELLNELVTSGRAHWFEFAINDRGVAAVRLTEQGVFEWGEYFNSRAGHAFQLPTIH